MNILTINNLNVSFNNKVVLSNLNLSMNYGEIHVIMGPNGVGKSTLAKVLTGYIDGLDISGDILYNGKSIIGVAVDKLALDGVFLSFQNPVSIPGLTNIQFLKSIINNKRKNEGIPPIESGDFMKDIRSVIKKLKIKEDLLYRFVNDGFSGGEKKRNEILQLLLLNPKLAILDEIDSGLDIDALKDVCEALLSYISGNNSILMITHYNRILKYISPNYVHILLNGKIVKTGDINIAFELEDTGYSSI